MIKKVLGILLAVMMIFGAVPVLAEEAVTLSGIVVEATDESVLIETKDQGQVLAVIDKETVCEGFEGILETGSFVIVTYDGKMTRSIPGQIYAQKIAMYVIRGEVSEITEDGMLVEQYEDKGQVLVRLPEEIKALPVGAPVAVYFDGVMTASLPGQVNALYVYTPMVAGEVTEIEMEYFMVKDAEGELYQMNTSEDTAFDREVAKGDKVTVYFNGAMTFSIPPQSFAIAVVHAVEAAA